MNTSAPSSLRFVVSFSNHGARRRVEFHTNTEQKCTQCVMVVLSPEDGC